MVSKYLQEHSLAWSASTLKSEASRLKAIEKALDGNPTHLWSLLTHKKPYTRTTTWTRVVHYWDWLIEKGQVKDGKNPYREFRRKNARLFRNVYVRRVPDISYQDAVTRINKLDDPQVKAKALQLLSTGCRWAESFTYKDGEVIGKGGKRRRVYGNDVRRPRFTRSYGYFWKQLAKVELKPHDLRKIFFNEVVNNGASVFELCTLAGWSKLDTAQSYIKANEKRLEKIVKGVTLGKE